MVCCAPAPAPQGSERCPRAARPCFMGCVLWCSCTPQGLRQAFRKGLAPRPWGQRGCGARQHAALVLRCPNLSRGTQGACRNSGGTGGGWGCTLAGGSQPHRPWGPGSPVGTAGWLEGRFRMGLARGRARSSGCPLGCPAGKCWCPELQSPALLSAGIQRAPRCHTLEPCQLLAGLQQLPRSRASPGQRGEKPAQPVAAPGPAGCPRAPACPPAPVCTAGTGLAPREALRSCLQSTR